MTQKQQFDAHMVWKVLWRDIVAIYLQMIHIRYKGSQKKSVQLKMFSCHCQELELFIAGASDQKHTTEEEHSKDSQTSIF